MPSHDAVVVGAGLSGLTAGLALAESGADVALLAKGMAASHWVHGGIDIADSDQAPSSAAAAAALASLPGHPYAVLADDLPGAVADAQRRLVDAGLPYRGGLDAPLEWIPTAIGGLRRAAILPDGQAAVLDPWEADEGLLLVGVERYRDFWAGYAARNLAAAEWPGGPARVRAAVVELPGLARLRNLTPLVIARLFDDPAWRRSAWSLIRQAVPSGRWRIGVPAVLGLDRHAEVFVEAVRELGPVFEMPSLPPSVPGIRLHDALRRRFEANGGRLEIGFGVTGVERSAGVVTAVETAAAGRPRRVAGGVFVLATGGLAGGGLRGLPGGRLEETVFGLPVSSPSADRWFSGDPLGSGVELERAGISVDADLRPLDTEGRVVLDNVLVVGSGLSGMRYLSERCGDGVALASGHRAGRLIRGGQRAATTTTTTTTTTRSAS